MPKAKTTETKHPRNHLAQVMALWLCCSALHVFAANPGTPTPAPVVKGTVTPAPTPAPTASNQTAANTPVNATANADMEALIEAARVRKAKEWQEQSKKAINPVAEQPAVVAPVGIPTPSPVAPRKNNDLDQPRVWSILSSVKGDVIAEVLYQEKIYTVQANRPVRMGPWHMLSLNSQQLVMRRDLTAAEKKKWPRQLKASERKMLEDTGVQVDLFAPDSGVSMDSYFPGENHSESQTHSNNFVLPASALRAANLPVPGAWPASANGTPPGTFPSSSPRAQPANAPGQTPQAASAATR